MDIRIGDIVKFLTEKSEGKVTGIINNHTVQVYVDEYGFEIPASIHDLVVVHSEQISTVAPHPQSSTSAESTDKVYLAIVPDHFANLLASNYELFIVNDTSQTCLFSVAFRKENQYTGIIAGNCQPNNISSIGSYTLKEIDTGIQAVHIQAIFFQKGKNPLRQAIETELKLSPIHLCKTGNYKHSHWFHSISMLRPLEQEHSPKITELNAQQLKEAMKEKQSIMSPPKERSSKRTTGNVIEIDLHSHEILETTAGMSNKDILEYQLDVFHQTMDNYKLRKGQKIIFIHGKGEGVLRQRILWELQTKYKRHLHQDASFKQYGYGATMVTIK